MEVKLCAVSGHFAPRCRVGKAEKLWLRVAVTIYKSYYQFQIYSFVDQVFEEQMAEAVKNNSRKRRPPSHFFEGYNEDNFEPGNNQHSGAREQNRQGGDPFTISAMSRMLTKFINSANKKYSQVRVKRQEQQNASLLKKQAASESKPAMRSGKWSKQERQAGLSQGREADDPRDNTNRQDPSKQRYQQKNLKKIPNSSLGSSVPQFKKQKPQPPGPETLLKNVLPSHDLFNIESMAKVSREQLFKMLPKGTDPNLFKEQLMNSADPQNLRSIGRVTQNLARQQPIRVNQFRPDGKLFKRASYHIGIAYNIHIQNLKQRNPNFTQQELDPTSVSRRLKQQSSDVVKKQEEERARRLQEEAVRQKQQKTSQSKSSQKQVKTEGEKVQAPVNIHSSAKKEPICIDIQDESEQNCQIVSHMEEQPLKEKEKDKDLGQKKEQEKKDQVPKPQEKVEKEEEPLKEEKEKQKQPQ